MLTSAKTSTAMVQEIIERMTKGLTALLHPREDQSSCSTRLNAVDNVIALHARPPQHVCHQRKKIPLPDPGIHSASGARLQHDGGRLVTSRRLFHACAVQKPTLSLGVVSLSTGTGVIFAQTLEHCSFLTRSRRNTAKHSYTRKRVHSLSKGCWLRPCRQLV